MSSSFFDRIDELAARVGDGQLVGSVEVNQLYAKFQHEGLDLNHPKGGQAKFLETPLYDHAAEAMQNIADDVLDSGPEKPMIANVEALSGRVEKLAPVDIGNLRESGHPVVTSGDTTVYDRPPVQRRLTEDELKALHHGHPYGH